MNGEDVFVYPGGVAEDDEAEVVHVLLRDALDVLRGDGADAFEERVGVAPAAADEFAGGEVAGLRGVCLLLHVVAREEAGDDGSEVGDRRRFALQLRDFKEHHADGLIGVNGCDGERSQRADRKVATGVQRRTTTRVSGQHVAQGIPVNPEPASLYL